MNSEGMRFVNELGPHPVVSNAILDKCSCYKDGEYSGPPFAWCILGPESQEIFGLPSLSFYRDQLGLFETCAGVADVAALTGCNEDILLETLQAYADARAEGKCLSTKKDIFPAELSPDSQDFVVARVTPSIHYTMGGMSINAAGEVQERINTPIGVHHVPATATTSKPMGFVHTNNTLGYTVVLM